MRVAVPLILICLACSKPSAREGEHTVKFEQYYVQGEQLYVQHCSNCHQKSGTGLGRVYPPVGKSDFIDDHLDEVICLLKYGREGELTVNGTMFNQTMPPTNLSNLEIAEVATYLYNNWGRSKGIIEVSTIDTYLQKCDSIVVQPGSGRH